MDESTTPVTVVTGADSGIGRATTLHLASVGHRVVGTVLASANTEKLFNLASEAGVTIDLVEMDISEDDSVRLGFERIFELTDRIDVLVNNAGVGGNAAVEETTSERFQEVFNINLCGATRCTQAVLPGMRQRGSGTIVNITSVLARIPLSGQAPYIASKWALEGVSEALAQEVAPFGIRVAIIEPGITKSSMFAKNVDTPNVTAAYDQHYRRMFQFYAAGKLHATDPVEVAKVIEHAITTNEPRLRYPVSWCSPEMSALHDRVDDADWLELGTITDDAEYAERFAAVFGVEI